jgi:plastocyanin
MLKPGINMTVGVLLLIVAFGISTPVLWGAAQLVKEDKVAQASGGGGGGGGGATGQPVAVTLVAQNVKFDLTTITASAGVQVTVTLDNKDAGVLHNVAFYTDRSASSAIHKGDLLTGPGTEDVVFTAPSTPGTYFFRCDVHPDTMNGTFIVQ